MSTSFLDLPAEVRLMVYSHLFTSKVAFVEAGTQDETPSLLPAKATTQLTESCSGQMLRACKTVHQEAEPILYDNTHFYVLTQAFAGKLPLSMSNIASFYPKVRNLTWQLHCDLMKHFYPEDFVITSAHLAHFNSLELRCQAENWKGSFCGEWVDRETFVRGRNQMIAYAQRVQNLMNQSCARKAVLVENRTGLSKGRVVLRLSRGSVTLSEDVSSFTPSE